MAYPNPTYTDSRYAFTAATPKRKYIKYLAQIAKCNANGFEPTRAQVQVALGDPDPTKPAAGAARWIAEGYQVSPRCNWGNARWAAMKQAGLIRSERVGNTVRYQITGEGLMLLHSVR